MTAAFILTVASSASPYTPSSDEAVLLRLRRPSRRIESVDQTKTRPDTGVAQAHQQDFESAARMAWRDIEISRAESNPRFLGYAQAALMPWWEESNPPAELLVLRATLRQSNHRFEIALADVDRALTSDPENARAWLTKYNILRILGNYEAAKRTCLPLLRLSSELVAVTCTSHLGSLSGRAETSYQLLFNAYHRDRENSPEILVWAQSILADIAWRQERLETAERHFREALGLGKPDAFLLGEFSDFLLQTDRPSEVIKLLKERTKTDGLLLRFALAERMLSRSGQDAKKHIIELDSRFAASRHRTFGRHLREEARFYLRLGNQPRRALELARKNWGVEREPVDARILLEAALGAEDPAAAAPVLDWIESAGIEDYRLERLVGQFPAGS